MNGNHGEPVEVWLRQGKPARFGWRGRMYTVLFALDMRPASEQECWQVEATPVRTVPPATYELCRDTDTGRWSLSRA